MSHVMPTTHRLAASCKINLYLHITGLLPGGYHSLDTLFFPLAEPHDVLDVTLDSGCSGLELTCSNPALKGDDNLIAQAWRAFGERTGYSPPMKVHLTKNIPAGAGLGGGSSDAAAILLLLNDLAEDRALPSAELHELAASLGADVPFFLLNHPAKALGIGDQLTPVDVDMRGLTLLLACPDEHVPTGWAYKAWDELHPDGGASLTRPKHAGKGPFCPADMGLANDFEQVVLPAFPRLERVKRELIESGAVKAVMSGSGAAIFGLYAGVDAAQAARKRLSVMGVTVHITRFD